MWNEIRDLFPVTRNCVYLNNAGVVPPSLRVLQALEAFHRTHAHHGWKKADSLCRDAGTRIKEILGTLIGCPAGSIALTRNTSEGMNIVAQGLHWEAGDSVLGLDEEYPANVYPWWNLEKKGVRYVRVKPTHSPTDLDTIRAEMDGRTRLVSVSAVNWCTGHVLDLDSLGEACRQNGTTLVVDMAQALGVLPLAPERWGASAMAGSAWKWLMGPVGVGIFYCSLDLLNRLDLAFVGTNTVPTENLLDYCFTPKADASRFEFSTPNFNDWIYFLASLELLQEIGFRSVRKRILSLKAYLCDGLVQKAYQIRGSVQGQDPSGIVAFFREGMSAGKEVLRLAEQNIVVQERDGAIRASPHIYNNEEDLDRLLNALE